MSRRSALKVIGVSGGIVFGSGTAVAHGNGDGPKPSRHDVVWGDELEVGSDGSVRTYATTNPAGNLSSLGVHMDCEAFTTYDTGEAAECELEAHLGFPTEDVDTHQFTFMGFHFNPEGHPPPGVYTVPHFDFHFYTMAHADVEAIPLGVAAYTLPDEQHPDDYVLAEPRVIEPHMGEHLLDSTSPEVEQGDQDRFTHTYIYGLYDPGIVPGESVDTVELPLGPGGEVIDVDVYEGDGEGELTFVEPMITTDFIRDDLHGETPVGVSTPDVFPVADDYPTKYVMEPDGDGGLFVSIDEFEEFPGPSG